MYKYILWWNIAEQGFDAIQIEDDEVDAQEIWKQQHPDFDGECIELTEAEALPLGRRIAAVLIETNEGI